VGNADALMTEGNRFYNRKSYGKAATQYLRATRANPSAIQAYLSLARSYMGAKQVQNACLAYRAYLKAAPESAEKAKAQGELELCERRLKVMKKKRADPTPEYTELKALFAGAMEQKLLIGPGSAGESLKSLVQGGYVGTDLGDMAAKLNTAAAQAADDIYKRALAHDRVPVEELTRGKRLYQLAVDVGPAPPNYVPHIAFLEGLAQFQLGEPKKAELRFAEASLGEPAVLEYKFYRAIAMYRSGNKTGALQALEADLPQDPRTAVLRTALALGNSPDAAAAELEQVLFQKRFPGAEPRRP
jgi:tetratricopeptide (TPR) repeat protein